MPATVTVRWMDGKVARSGTIADLQTARETGTVWVDVFEPDAQVLAPIAAEFDLHPLAIEDCLDFPERPKIDSYPGSMFIVWVLPSLLEGDGMEYAELDIFLGTGFLVTSHRDHIQVIDDVVDSADSILCRGEEWTLHSLLDRAVDAIFPAVDYIADRLDSIEDSLLEQASDKDLHDLYAMKRLLIALHKTVGPERDVVRGMARQTEFISQDTYMYFQDIGDHLARVVDSVETYRDVASGAMDIYLSAVNNRMNQIMKQLTVVATIFMPLTLLSGIYGMNVLRGMWPPADAGWSFAAIIGSMVAITIAMLWAFRRRNWW